jgi:hypothetical protein
MAMKEQQRQVYRTARGKQVDMNKLINQNELTIAVGNAKVNARGDKLGANGEVVKTREEILKERDASLNQPIVPNQVNIRTSEKDVSDMDPEGKE